MPSTCRCIQQTFGKTLGLSPNSCFDLVFLHVDIGKAWRSNRSVRAAAQLAKEQDLVFVTQHGNGKPMDLEKLGERFDQRLNDIEGRDEDAERSMVTQIGMVEKVPVP